MINNVAIPLIAVILFTLIGVVIGCIIKIRELSKDVDDILILMNKSAKVINEHAIAIDALRVKDLGVPVIDIEGVEQ